jgi:hypothetical protein
MAGIEEFLKENESCLFGSFTIRKKRKAAMSFGKFRYVKNLYTDN